MERLRLLLVEDHQSVREGLKLLLDRETDFQVVAEASDGEGALDPIRLEGVDVAVMDLSMPGLSGLETTRRLKALRPDIAVVTFTRHADKSFLQELLRAGAAGYVLKQSPQSELFRAIRAAAGGLRYVDPALAHHFAAPFLTRDGAQPPGGRATVREAEVLRLVARGHSNKEIAADLGLSVKTVEVHKSNAMRKLELNGRIELLRFAMQQGWLHDG